MSAALVRKSLAIIDEDFNFQKRSSKKQGVKNLIPENQKLLKIIKHKGRKEKIEILKNESKITIHEAQKRHKSKEELIKENLSKLQLINQLCNIELQQDITEQLIERAVTRRPISKQSKHKKEQKTAFTEEDFAKFEAEYFDES